MADPPRYPVMLDLAGRRCLVVGGGSVALRKSIALVEAGAVVSVAAPVLLGGLSDLAADGMLDWVDRTVRLDDPVLREPWRLVVAATDDPTLNAAIAGACDERGIWATDVSAHDGGAVSTPAVHRQGPVTITVSTSGVSPSAAAWLRDEVAGGLDPAVVVALELLAEVVEEDRSARRGPGGGPATSQEEVRPTVVSGHTRERSARVDWQQVLDSGTLDDIRHGHRARAKERLQACLSSSSD